MVSAGRLVEGREIRLGALVFTADDSTWLQEAPLNVDALSFSSPESQLSAFSLFM